MVTGLGQIQGLCSPYSVSVLWVTRARRTLTGSDPATGETIGHVPDQREGETVRAIEAAAEAFETWQWSSAKVSRCLAFSSLMRQD
jgi:acyl-CoA reductase-like NAD-dependent aldehyde dehydrogenase